MAEAASTELSIPDSDESTEILESSKNPILETLTNTETIRQVTMIVTLVICVAIAIFIFIWSKEPAYRPLVQMPHQEMIETLDHLDQNQIEYKIEGNTILVLDSEFKNVKLGLARQGLTPSANQGTDIIMQDMGFGVSQRVEMERLKHAREQLLARTIEDINAVGKARVLLAIPKENVFARRESKASATVVVTAQNGTFLSGEEVDAIVDIVASAVQGIDPTRVTVTDNNGRLLNSGSADSVSAMARKEYEIEKNREMQYLEKIDSILIPVLGVGNYTAQADVSMDFTKVEQTQRQYNPDLPAVRSEMLSEQNTVGAIIAGIPGALSNQPPGDSQIPENATDTNAGQATPGNTSRESTRNYELDTTISHTKKQTGVISRLSVSVAIDHKNSIDANGESVSTPLSQEELLNIRRLLQGGIGFDVTRGDSLEVVSIPFNRIDIGEVAPLSIWEEEWFMPIFKLFMGATVIIVLIMAVVRPMLKKLLFPENGLLEQEHDDADLDLGDETIDVLSEDFDEAQVGFSPDGSLMLPNLHGDEDVLKAIRALVANEPELSAQVVRGWLLEDE
ncbi:flagellar basal-body MS-ring/collar protein FliF [Glaciecola petra]|uniref:Flagellar M-ring protein n=1 Tax=Glaciecola petra TaxID=3075602 RepID=A0ABU2ZQC7_9ALTE|nr:flagellar basal-body MS-ring/collar protein FliF [Aestuariibacter sp. P117]MDT0593809.1 flagellar basal-body MS-ring/collar protein FliF [Aestuariibacter sp. P117]